MKTLVNINVFENRKAQELFLELSNGLEGEKKELFSTYVLRMFDEKSVSEEGLYNSFKITQHDVAAIYDILDAALKIAA